MTRNEFIRGLLGTFGLAILPKSMVHQYCKIYLLQSFIRGFRFYEGPELLQAMKEGDMLELVREPNNPHDNCAVALHFNQHKLGYLPREDNEILSRLLDAGVIELLAEITHLKPQAAAWENVHIAVYVLKALDGASLPEESGYLTVLDTPHYRTLKYPGNNITKICYDNAITDKMSPEYDGNSFYASLIEHSETDEVYDLIHTGFTDPEVMNEAVIQMKLVINRNRLPENIAADDVIKVLDNSIIALDRYFNQDGYVVANINRLAELSPKIARFGEILDKSGRRFFEVFFKA
jgi:hypothetical protein